MKKLTLEKWEELQKKVYTGGEDEIANLYIRVAMGETDAFLPYQQRFIDMINEFFTGKPCSK